MTVCDGTLWPWGTDGDRSRPYVERCDDCAVFDDDEDAADHVARREGGIVVLAMVHDAGGVWQPAVYTGAR